MLPNLYWEGLFEVIERALNPRKGKDWRPPAPPSKRVAKRKPKAKTKKRTVPKAKAPTRKPRAKPRAKRGTDS